MAYAVFAADLLLKSGQFREFLARLQVKRNQRDQ
jgi:hypothetical protein